MFVVGRAPLRTCALVACLLAFGRPGGAQYQEPTIDDGATCPAWQQSCDMSLGGGTIPYFAPDPLDAGAACDASFLNWDATANAASPSSCYGRCDVQANDPNDPNYDPNNYDCYLGCQDAYAACLRNALGLGAQRIPSIRSDPRRTPSISGNRFRSCIAGHVPSSLADEFQACRAQGRTRRECCSEIANLFV